MKLILTTIILSITLLIASCGQQTESSNTENELTKQSFLKIQNGMPYSQCKHIIGFEGELVSETELEGFSSKIYSWSNADGSNCMLTFQEDQLINKSQAGLK